MKKEITVLHFAGIMGLMVVVGAMASFFSVDPASRDNFKANVFNFATGNEESQVVQEVEAYMIPQTYADQADDLSLKAGVKVKTKTAESITVNQGAAPELETQEQKVSRVKRYVEE